ncbi:MAG: hypothetical protein EPGJADBJ_02889 [Saprospiraceae bacterium]|nr:hypothetical protein [Saprospiraceae bacterium]
MRYFSKTDSTPPKSIAGKYLSGIFTILFSGLLTVGQVSAQPEIAIKGNGVIIVDGDNTPGPTDYTDYGVTSAATGVVVRTFTIYNQGGGQLQLTGSPKVVIGGASTANFTVSVQPPAIVNPGDSATFSIAFNPDAIGEFTATVSISNNDANENPFNFILKGAGEFDIRDCTDPCTGQDVTVESVEMNDEFGNPLPPNLCSSPGTTVVATTLSFTILNHTSASRQAIRVAADIFLDGIDSGDDVIFCFDGPIAGNDSAVVTIGPFAYTLGQTFELRNFKIAWRTANNADCSNSMVCNSYPGGQCSPIAALPDFTVTTPLAPSFSSILPPPCFPSLKGTFQSSITGGTPPYTYSWNFGDPASGTNNSSTLPEAEHEFSSAGNFTVSLTVTDSKGVSCTVTVPVSLTQPTVAAVSVNGMLTCLNPTLVLNGSGSSTGPNFTYQWISSNGNPVNGGNTLQPTIGQPGTYTLVVTNQDNGCTASTTITVSADQTLPYSNAGPPQVLTCLNSTVQLQGSGSNGTGFSIQWTANPGFIVSGANTFTPTVNQAGTYILVVTNTLNGCSSTASILVTSNTAIPSANAGPPLQLNCAHPTLQLQGSGSNGPGFTIQWTANPGFIINGANTYTPTVNQSGTYTLKVTDIASGCTNEATVTVTAVFYDPLVSIDPPEMITCITSTVVINGSAISQGGSLLINWTTANGNIVSGGNTTNVTVDQPGIYTLTAVNDVGCTATASIQVIKNTTPPVVNAGPNAVLNCSVQQLALVGSGSTGPDFSYSWTTADGHIISGQNTLNPVIDSAGTYTLVVTNTLNDCTAESSVTITTDYTPPVANAGGDVSITCANLMTAQLNGSGSSTGTKYKYQWVANPGNIVSGANTLNDVVVNTAGSYTLIVTDVNNGCTDEDAVTVSEAIDYPVAYILPPQQLDCAVLMVQLDAAGSTQGSNLTYAWATINGNIVSGGNTLSPVVNKAGTYQLLVTDTENSCTDTASVTVVQDIIPPLAVVESPAPITCQNSQIQLNGSGSSAGYSFLYEWSTQNGNILSGSTTLTPLVDKAGTYILTVSNMENNCTAQASVQVSELKIQPAANAGSTQDITCSVQQIALNGNGSSQGAQYQYVWNTPNGNIVSGVNTLNPLVDAPGTYYLNVINVQTGCTAVSSVIVGVDQTAPQAVVAPGGELNCNTSSLTLDGTGSSTGSAITYLWSSAGGVIQSGQNTLNPVVNAAGTYKLVVTNTINGCTAAASTVVTSDATVPLASAGLPDTLTCLVTQLLLDGTASSQGSDFTYLWTGPSVVSGSNTLNPLIDGPGLYELIVTNTSNGCTALSTVNIPANMNSPVADAGPDAVLNCINNTLVLDGSASSSGPLFTYQWLATSGGNIVSGGSTLSPLIDSPGTYSLTVTNTANGCTGTDVVNISQNTVPPVANAGTPGTITCINTTVTLNGNGSTGPDFIIQWTTPDGSIVSGTNTYSPVVDAQGTYNLVVTNYVNGCSAMSSVAVTKDADVPIAIVQAPNELNCIVQQIQLNGAGSTAGPSIQYNWTTTSGNIASGANTLTPTVNAPGQYTLTVFDSSNNCKALFTVHVIQNLTPPLANAGAPAILSCSNPVLTLNGSGSSQGAQFSYQWTTTNGNILEGANTLSPKVNNSGFYTLVVTNNQNACTASSTVQLLLDQNSPQAQAGPGMALTCVTQSVTLNTSGTSIGPGFTYQWTVSAGGNIVSGANGPAPVVNAPGTYTLLVTNPLNGCTALDSVNIIEDVLPPVAVITPPEKLNCQIVQTTINTTGSSSGAQFSYKWTTSNGNIIAGAYSPEPVVNMPGTYYVQITNNSNGCTMSAGTIVNQDISLPSADAGQATGLDCANTSVSLNGTAGNAGSNPQITWETADGNIVSGANTLNPVVDAPGLYVLTVSNTANLCSSSAQVTVYQDTTPPIVVTAAPPELSCVVSVVTLNAVGSSAGSVFTSQWEAQNGGNILSGASTLAPSVNAAGLYLLTISNGS